MNSKISLTAILMGMLLMVASATWGSMFPPSQTWTAEKSEQLAKLGSKTNILKFAIIEAENNQKMHAGKNPAELRLEYGEVLEEYNVLHQDFLNASEQPQQMAAIFRWTGIALIVIGAILTLIARGG